MKKNYKKFIQIIVGFFLLFAFSNTFAYDEEHHYDFSRLGSFSANDSDFYIGEVSSSHPFRLHVVYESYDCEQYNDFAFMINGINASIPCSGDGNRDYIVEFGTYENMEADSVYEMSLIKYRDDRRGIGSLDLYIEYLDTGSGTGSGSGSTNDAAGGSGTDFLFGKKFDLFSDVEDLRNFLKWEGGVLLFFMLSIVMLKLFIYKP